MSEARKKLNEENKKKKPYVLVRPELTAEDILKARQRGIRVAKVRYGITPEQYGHVYSIGSGKGQVGYRVTVSDEELKRLEELKGQEAQVKEKIKRKQEEVRLYKEHILIEFKNMIRHMIDDEEKGIERYVELLKRARVLGLAENIRDLQLILNDEQRHLSLLKAMLGTWIARKR